MTAHAQDARRRLIIRRVRITGWTALSFLIATIIGALAWAHVVYPADRAATIDVFRSSTVTVDDHSRAIIISPVANANATDVMVFYPGGRVDPYAYLPPFAHTAQTLGLRIVIPKPPLNLAIADTRDIGLVADLAGDYESIIVAGHSLGGVRGCLMADDPRVGHLILLASYCANDLTARTDLRVLTVLAQNDGLTDSEQVSSRSGLLPPGARTVIIPGANHASFGVYGPQAGDGQATITPSDVVDELTVTLSEFLRTSD